MFSDPGQQTLFSINTVFLVLTVVTVLGRLLARHIKKHRLGPDDWICMAALASHATLATLVYLSTHRFARQLRVCYYTNLGCDYPMRRKEAKRNRDSSTRKRVAKSEVVRSVWYSSRTTVYMIVYMNLTISSMTH